ncbi:MAG: lipoprotein [Granulosicoccaceae bacterium]
MDDTNVKQIKTCASAHFVIILTIGLSGCGNKGPLVQLEAIEKPVTIEPQSQDSDPESNKEPE